jgi:hypothetical protein
MLDANNARSRGLIKLVTTVADDLRILPQFLEYYRMRGVAEFIVNITDQVGDGAIVGRCRALLHRYPHRIANVYVGKQSWVMQCDMIRRSIVDHCNEHDWVLLPDVDELHEYPVSLSEFLESCTDRGINLVTGEFLDRVSRSGELVELCANTPLFAQFPIGCRLSINVLQVPRLRTVAVRGNLAIEKHFATEEDAVVSRGIASGLIQPTPDPAVVIHHFKWHSRVIARIAARRARYRRLFTEGDSRFALHSESDRLLEYLQTRGDRIDLEDPALEAVPIFDRKARGAA